MLGIPAQRLNVAFLVALAFAVAASGNLPAILYSLFWKRFNTARRRLAIYGGLGVGVFLVVFSPVVSRLATKAAVHRASTSSWFPLNNPGIVSIPLGFLCGFVGTVLSKEYNAEKYAEIEVRSLTGAGAETAVKD